jgi:hypothetical protein
MLQFLKLVFLCVQANGYQAAAVSAACSCYIMQQRPAAQELHSRYMLLAGCCQGGTCFLFGLVISIPAIAQSQLCPEYLLGFW